MDGRRSPDLHWGFEMQKGILVIDGDDMARSAMIDTLRRAGYECAQASSVQEALGRMEEGSFALAVLDAELPELARTNLLQLLRARGGFPVIVTALRSDEKELIHMLNAGAEDYLFKPFEGRELAGRVGLLLKRFDEGNTENTLQYKHLTLNSATLAVTLCDQPLELTKQEYRILELMLSSPPGRVFSKRDFYDYAWDGNYVGVDKTINVHICNIRRKMRAITEEEYIETIWGFGFRLA